jgi:DNA-binding transcriptional LysR family regulator
VQMLDRILIEQKVKLPLVWRFNSLGAIKQALMSGIGVSVLPEISVKSELSTGSLAGLPWHEKGIVANLLMIWKRDKWIPPVLQAFMDMVREGLAA